VSEPEVQIDTLRFAFDTSLAARSMSPKGARANVVNLGTESEAWSFSVDLPSGGQVMWGDSARAVVELNVSKAAQGHNVVALPVAATLDVARAAFDEAGQVLERVAPFEDSYVNRVDLVRDFEGVTRPVQTMQALRAVPMVGKATARLFSDASRGGAMTLTKGNGARSSTLYDKAGEVQNGAPRRPGRDATNDDWQRFRAECAQHGRLLDLAAGRLRFEARVRKEPLRRAGIATVTDLRDVERLGGLRRSMFGWAGFDREVSALSRVTEKVLLDGELSDRERVTALGYFLLVAQGVQVDSLMSRNTQRKYRRIAEELGMCLDGDGVDQGTFVAQLDYDGGREVIRAA
jgi:hypothetical protein